MNTRKTAARMMLLLLFTLLGSTAWAQKDKNDVLIHATERGWEYEIRAGFNIGGTSPLPLPDEIRSIDSYEPPLSLMIEGNVTRWIGKSRKWGIVTGLKIEPKGMTAKATVKNYGMEIIGDDGNSLAGQWTGGVKTKVRNEYITMPLLAACKVGTRWRVKFGCFFSYLVDGEFSGTVYDGYIREGDPTGKKVVFTDGAVATYDFSDDLREFSWGLQAGADWKAFNHLNIFADLTWGLNDIFESDFETITFAMYPIYLNLGFGYAF